MPISRCGRESQFNADRHALNDHCSYASDQYWDFSWGARRGAAYLGFNYPSAQSFDSVAALACRKPRRYSSGVRQIEDK